MDDEGAALGHHGEVAHEDVLLADLAGLFVDEAHHHAERRGEGHVLVAALVDGLRGLAELVLAELHEQLLASSRGSARCRRWSRADPRRGTTSTRRSGYRSGWGSAAAARAWRRTYEREGTWARSSETPVSTVGQRIMSSPNRGDMAWPQVTHSTQKYHMLKDDARAAGRPARRRSARRPSRAAGPRDGRPRDRDG